MKALKCLWITLLLVPLAACTSDSAGEGDESGEVVGYTHPLGAGEYCDPDGEDQCPNYELTCTQVLEGKHELWACAEDASTPVPLFATGQSAYHAPDSGMGEQQEYELELKIVGFEEILTSDELTIVDAPRGDLDLREEGVFYTAPSEPYAVEAPFEDWPEDSKTFRYDAFTFRLEEGPMFGALIELNAAVMETVSHGANTHPWDVTLTTEGPLSVAFSSTKGLVTADRRWKYDGETCAALKETLSNTRCEGALTAVASNATLSVNLHLAHGAARDADRPLYLGNEQMAAQVKELSTNNVNGSIQHNGTWWKVKQVSLGLDVRVDLPIIPGFPLNFYRAWIALHTQHGSTYHSETTQGSTGAGIFSYKGILFGAGYIQCGKTSKLINVDTGERVELPGFDTPPELLKEIDVEEPWDYTIDPGLKPDLQCKIFEDCTDDCDCHIPFPTSQPHSPQSIDPYQYCDLDNPDKNGTYQCALCEDGEECNTCPSINPEPELCENDCDCVMANPDGPEPAMVPDPKQLCVAGECTFCPGDELCNQCPGSLSKKPCTDDCACTVFDEDGNIVVDPNQFCQGAEGIGGGVCEDCPNCNQCLETSEETGETETEETGETETEEVGEEVDGETETEEVGEEVHGETETEETGETETEEVGEEVDGETETEEVGEEVDGETETEEVGEEVHGETETEEVGEEVHGETETEGEEPCEEDPNASPSAETCTADCDCGPAGSSFFCTGATGLPGDGICSPCPCCNTCGE